MSVLPGGDISEVGASQEAGAGHAVSKCVGVSLPLLPVQEDLQALSGRHDESRSDGAVEVVCSDLLDIGIELSGGEHDLEWFRDPAVPNDGVAGCPGAGREAEAAKPVEAGAGAGVGWGLCVGVG